jgi:hypothetical protein
MFIENRLLQLYQSHYLDREYQKKVKKLELELSGLGCKKEPKEIPKKKKKQ